MLIGLQPDHVDLFRLALLKLLLQVSASMLILAEGIYLATELLKLHVRKSVHGYEMVSFPRGDRQIGNFLSYLRHHFDDVAG
jgi:hypothetical protein